ncbi:glycoside hydrolase family 88 protein [Flavivirga spongiicola]|uniref:Glycoside hydrolase family 88 protein n=1 Tax=Flavivirga spongiicola TaxID=421621 RepID=A0ABU7XZ92_9FLAO|nr:glycoside hydrolase family 88 protein [Flavivirga sp. MEBiC05379]MDO5980164.1 glycoside hydrolase family 88 protein [Flavivirga sp. MEBiC05379]MDO5981912.1 glycoside hydrolase family 88 protein [Flavivirga sp. MEBiC05379]
MRNLYSILFLFMMLCSSCTENSSFSDIREAMVVKANDQYNYLYNTTNSQIGNKNRFPRTIDNRKIRLVHNYDWTSGFYPGSLWYLHALTGDSKWEKRALQYTKKLDTIQYWKGNHDVGFIIECSYGNALKVAPSEDFNKVIVQTAKSLSSRFHIGAGIIQSWDSNKKWDCPVIIDNMMNLELLFHASKISGDSKYYDIAISHANNTIKNHYRDDFSSYHVLDYNKQTGEIEARNTAQGYADESAWARGQAWGFYGFMVCYRETKDEKYLEQAIKIANFIKNHPQLPKDKIPYWDYDAPKTKDTPRDASAAAITASALYELSTFVKEDREMYLDFADTIMSSLSSSDYFAEKETNKGFLLKHSVGSIPHGVEIDVPLNYADYYYLEALYRSKTLN